MYSDLVDYIHLTCSSVELARWAREDIRQQQMIRDVFTSESVHADGFAAIGTASRCIESIRSALWPVAERLARHAYVSRSYLGMSFEMIAEHVRVRVAGAIELEMDKLIVELKDRYQAVHRTYVC